MGGRLQFSALLTHKVRITHVLPQLTAKTAVTSLMDALIDRCFMRTLYLQRKHSYMKEQKKFWAPNYVAEIYKNF